MRSITAVMRVMMGGVKHLYQETKYTFFSSQNNLLYRAYYQTAVGPTPHRMYKVVWHSRAQYGPTVKNLVKIGYNRYTI